MKHRVAAHLGLSIDDSRIRIEVDQQANQGLCLALALLVFDLIDTIALFDVSKSSNTKLELRRAPRGQEFASLGGWSVDGVPQLYLSDRELEFLMTFLLRYHRDACSEVDHVDLEADVVGDGDRRVDVAIVVTESVPPVADKEARRRLGL